MYIFLSRSPYLTSSRNVRCVPRLFLFFPRQLPAACISCTAFRNLVRGTSSEQPLRDPCGIRVCGDDPGDGGGSRV